MWRQACFVIFFSIAVQIGAQSQGGAQTIVIEETDDSAAPITPSTASSASADAGLPPGLFDSDPMIRLLAIEQVGKEKNFRAVDTLAKMAQTDSFVEVRRAACRVLGTMGAVSQVGVLKTIAAQDLDADVREEAAKAVGKLESAPQFTTKKEILADRPEESVKQSQSDGDAELEQYRKPELGVLEERLEVRHVAIGFGTMGGYGLAALDLRFRIPTGLTKGLTSVGIELGGGWTPPGFYPVIAGPIGEVDDKDNKWKIISAGGAVLLYLHRFHYIPLRGGFDIGQGPYGSLGYGFEQLNPEGFFSWGVEAGILYHPVIGDWVDKLVVDCDEDPDCDRDALWPVIPYVRFSLHFYLI